MAKKEAKTSPKVKKLGGKGLGEPEKLSDKEVSELGGSVLAHLPRKKTPKKPK